MAGKLKPSEVEGALEYLDQGGVICPFCKGTNVESDDPDIDGPEGRGNCKCLSCKREWIDVYRLVSVELCDGNGDVIDAVEAPKPAVLIEVRGGVGEFTASGDVDVTLVDWDNVDEETNPEKIRDLISDVEAMPSDCDENGNALRALTERLDSILEDGEDG